ncbi:hypothetical protein ACYEXS_32065 [Paenibacillus sp. MAH-36]|uniref:Uncharacterized protein n=1 Tax=Paenibacillus violae TaxID=3077234 RepID=A0ABU3RQR7_9BACL|nr:hypothetical protein [Paenibacillus sp. PFR10]MDU0206461.1 hypothetical protein [Paenibacillus sp. PFR10]
MHTLISCVVQQQAQDKFALLLKDQRYEFFMEILRTERVPLVAMEQFIKDAIGRSEIPLQNPRLSTAMINGALLKVVVFIDLVLLPKPLQEFQDDLIHRLSWILRSGLKAKIKRMP